jgi:outer membrane protein OmpA-like peptidoglycan-associated protein
MKLPTLFQSVVLSSTLALSALGCATAPPSELVNARASYDRARKGPAATTAPVQLRNADLALQSAEQSFQSGQDEQYTKDLAYVAERQARIAEAAATAALAQKELQTTQQALAKTQAATAQQAKTALAQSQGQLAQAAQRQTQTDATLKAAEKRATDASAALAALAAKEEERGTVITLSGSVLFATNEATLLPAARERLDQVADALLSQPDRTVTVEGHTDSRGSADHNMGLSQRRAEAVRSHLISRGYPAERIQARGMGLERPITGNETAEGRANNRRVEIVIQRAPAAPATP